MRAIPTLVMILVLASSTAGGKFNKKLSLGDKAPAWENLEGVDGKRHSLADLKESEVVVVVFTCNSCPVAIDYEDRILDFTKTHTGAGKKAVLVAINVNTIKADGLPEMKKRAEKKKYPFPYLFDPTQEIAKAFGAGYTPEFFVLDKDRKVVYMGAMDDKSPPGEPKSKYLEEAIAAALSGKPAPTGESSAAAGCRIRFNAKKMNDDE